MTPSTEVVSPELVLVDPTLRELALEQLNAPAAGAATVAVPGTTREADGGTRPALARDDSRARVDRGRGIRNYVLAASVLANLFLLGIVASGILSSSSSPPSAREATVTSTRSIDATAAAFAPAPARKEAKTTTRPSTQHDPEPALTRVGSSTRTAVGSQRADRAVGSRRADRAATREAKERPATVPLRGAVGRSVPRAEDARQRPSPRPGRAKATATVPVRVTRSRARAERDVLEFVRRSGALRRFVDPSTRLVKANVSVQCTPTAGRVDASRSSAFTCRLWQQPRPRSTGATVVYAARTGSGYAATVRTPGTP